MQLIGKKYSMDDVGFMKRVKERIASKGYRADLYLAGSEIKEGKQFIVVGFHPDVGVPSEQEIRTFVQHSFPNAEIEWKDYKTGQKGIEFSLVSNAERIKVEDFSKIPPGFKAIGTGMYKDAASGGVWSLEKESDGLVLVRQQEEIPPEDLTVLESLSQGDIVLTPVGRGEVSAKKANKVVVKFPKGEIREFKAQQVRKLYNQDQERSSLKDYYAKAYGDTAFADALTSKMGR